MAAWTKNVVEIVSLSAFVSSPVLSSPKFAQLFQSELNYINPFTTKGSPFDE